MTQLYLNRGCSLFIIIGMMLLSHPNVIQATTPTTETKSVPIMALPPSDLILNVTDNYWTIIDGWLADGAGATFTADQGCGPVMVFDHYNPSVSAIVCSLSEPGYSVKFTAMDMCGGMIDYYATIKILDDSAPYWDMLPMDKVIPCDMPGAQDSIQAWLDAYGMAWVDDYGDCGVTVTNNYNGVMPSGCNGTKVVRFTATDCCGYSSTATATIMIQDNSAPEFTAIPADETILCDRSPSFGTPVYHDACSNVTITHVDEVEGDCDTDLKSTRTWTITDDCGNSATASQVITTLVDDEVPVFTFVPADETIDCGETPSFGTPLYEDNCSDFDDISLQIFEYNTGNCDTGYVYVRQWIINDDCNNLNYAEQKIRIAPDQSVPVFTQVPADITLTCGQTATFGTPTYSDNCTPLSGLSITSSDTQSGDCQSGLLKNRTWTITDDCGNTATAMQTIMTLPDTELPVFQTEQTSNVYFNCDQAWGFDTPQVTDNCGNVKLTFVDQVVGDTTCTMCAPTADITRTWTAMDDCGNVATQVVTIWLYHPGYNSVVSFTQVPADQSVSCGDPIQFGTPTAVSSTNVPVSISFTDRTEGDCASGGVRHIRTWTASDDCGHTAIAEQVITVMGDDEVPIFLTHQTSNVYFNCDQPWGFDTPQVSDNCGNVNLTFVDQVTGDTDCTACAPTADITRTWTATDDCGNVATQQVTIWLYHPGYNSVVSFTQVPADQTVSCGDPIQFGTPTAVSSTNVPVSISFMDRTEGDCANGGLRHIRTWTVTDDCGHTATAEQVITVSSDNEAPVFLTQQTSNVYFNCDQPWGFDTPQVSDNCGNVNLSFTDQVIGDTDCTACAPTADIIRTWTATDACGNVATQQVTIWLYHPGYNSVVSFDHIPSNQTISCGDPVQFGTATASSSTNVPVSVTFTDSTQGDCSTGIQNIRTWTATDDCGHTATAQQIITQTPDNQPPIIQVTQHSYTFNCGAYPYFIPDPTITDNCTNIVDVTLVTVYLGDTTCVPGAADVDFYKAIVATDDCGNTSRDTIWGKIIMPTNFNVISFLFEPENKIITCADNMDFDEPEVTTACLIIKADYVDTFIDDCENGHQYTRTWYYENDCGYTASTSQIITIMPDNTPPTIEPIPSVVVDVKDIATWQPNPIVTDECSQVNIEIIDEPMLNDCTSPVLTKTIIATDACGNSASMTVQAKVEMEPFTVVPTYPGLMPQDMEVSLAANVSGGIPPYTYQWILNEESIRQGFHITSTRNEPYVTFESGRDDGMLQLQVTSANGCSKTVSLPLNVATPAELEEGIRGLDVQVYPTVAFERLYVQMFADDEVTTEVSTYNIAGQKVDDMKWLVPAGESMHELDVTNYAEGSYIILLSVKNKGTILLYFQRLRG